jgi:hypothetical protein
MSDLVYQNYNNKCKGWVNPSNLSYGPEIISLSSYQSPAGSSTVVSINGTNFLSFSTIRFGTFSPTVYFINSNILQFYVPNTLNSGTFPVQVFNGIIPSNSINYTIDNASGYWLLNPGDSITNTNTNGVIIQSPETYGSATLRISDTNSNQQILFSAKSGSGAYNPFTKPNSQEIVAFRNPGGPMNKNTQTLTIVPHSDTSCGITVSGGGGTAANAYCEIGCGGTAQHPSQSIRFDNNSSSIVMNYTNLSITTTTLPTTSSGATAFLPVTVNGTNYVIPLHSP